MSNRPTAKGNVPSSTKRRNAPPPASRYAAASAGGGDSARVWWIGGAVVVAIVVAVIVAVASGGGGSSAKATAPKSNAALIAEVTTVKASVFDAVGAGSASGTIAPISSQPSLTAGGKPRVVYIGAEYCPFCAAERWAMVMALSRFGTFTNLGVTHSSGTDVYPNTPTFSFHGATFTSQYLAFNGVETLSNVAQGASYAPLDTPTAEEKALLSKYDAPPYIDSGSAGAIPFIDIGNKFVVSGATYGPDVLQGKTADQIAAALSDTSSDISRGAVGSANVITAAICSITGQQPATVCSSAGVKAATSKLGG